MNRYLKTFRNCVGAAAMAALTVSAPLATPAVAAQTQSGKLDEAVAALRGISTLKADFAQTDRTGQRVTGVAIAVALGEREVEVSAVVDGSRAARAGLRVGDQLIEVDDVPVNSPAEARSLLRGAEGVPAILRIRRARRDRIVTVPRERYTQPDE